MGKAREILWHKMLFLTPGLVPNNGAYSKGTNRVRIYIKVKIASTNELPAVFPLHWLFPTNPQLLDSNA